MLAVAVDRHQHVVPAIERELERALECCAVTPVPRVRQHLNPRLELLGLLLTMADARTNLSVQVQAEVQKHFPGPTFRSIIPRTVRLSEAPSHGQSLLRYDPTSRGAVAYAALAVELAQRGYGVTTVGERS